MEIKVKCPSCSKILRLADVPNINEKTFKCPNCSMRHKVGDCLYKEAPKQTATSEATQYGSTVNSKRGEETQIGGNSFATGDETRIGISPVQLSIGCLIDSFGYSYKLSLGINTIGRQASTSPATVQINTQDRTMSRSHAIIEVRNSGGQIIHIVKNGTNKNPSYVNDTLIETYDQLILNNGDRVKFGITELTFKK